MSPSLVYILVFAIPLGFTLLRSVQVHKSLSADPILGASPSAINAFITSRAIYWCAFGMIFVAFALALIAIRQTGEATRSLLAQGNPILSGPYHVVISEWGIALLPLTFFGILAATVSLFFIGRAALKLMPEEEEPGPEFRSARARFFFLGFSLILPPLLFSLLLSI